MEENRKEEQIFHSIKVTDDTYYLLRRLALEERSKMYVLAERIVRDYSEKYFQNKKSQV